MSGWFGLFGGRGDTRESARDAIVGLRQQLLVLEKKEEFLQKKIDDEMKKARANATTNKRCMSELPRALPLIVLLANTDGLESVATAALRQKKAHENELDKMMGTRLTLETQVSYTYHTQILHYSHLSLDRSTH